MDARNIWEKIERSYDVHEITLVDCEKINRYSELTFTSDQLIPIGSFQFEFIRNRTTPRELLNLMRSYNLVLCATLQAIEEEEDNIIELSGYCIYEGHLNLTRKNLRPFSIKNYFENVNQTNL